MSNTNINEITYKKPNNTQNELICNTNINKTPKRKNVKCSQRKITLTNNGNKLHNGKVKEIGVNSGKKDKKETKTLIRIRKVRNSIEKERNDNGVNKLLKMKENNKSINNGNSVSSLNHSKIKLKTIKLNILKTSSTICNDDNNNNITLPNVKRKLYLNTINSNYNSNKTHSSFYRPKKSQILSIINNNNIKQRKSSNKNKSNTTKSTSLLNNNSHNITLAKSSSLVHFNHNSLNLQQHTSKSNNNNINTLMSNPQMIKHKSMTYLSPINQTYKSKHPSNQNNSLLLENNNNNNSNNNNNNNNNIIINNHNDNISKSQVIIPNQNNNDINTHPSNSASLNQAHFSKFKSLTKPQSTKIHYKSLQELKEEKAQRIIQMRKQFSERQTQNIKDLKCLYYIILPGNASYLVKQCMKHRINWKEPFSIKSSLYNFKWHQLSQGIDYSSINKFTSNKQMVNHYEMHSVISNKANLFINLFLYCEERNISIFKYVPFTIVHVLEENNENQNKLKFKQLETFINNANVFVKEYKDIGNNNNHNNQTQNEDEQNIMYSKVFPWLKAKRKKEVGLYRDKEKTICEIQVGNKTSIEIPSSHYNDTNKNMWIIKASNLNRGQCIKIVNTYEEMESVIKSIQEGVDMYFKSTQVKSTTTPTIANTNTNTIEQDNLLSSRTIDNTRDNTNNIDKLNNNNNNKEQDDKKYLYSTNKIIIQKYIEKPFLYRNRKCDMRIWVLITHKMKVYVFKEGHLKTCSVNYNIDCKNAYTHITNYSFQKYSEDFQKYEKGNEVSFEDFQLFINEMYPMKKYSVKYDLMKQVKEIVAMTTQCGKEGLNVNQRKYQFEIFGYDFMLDSDFNLFLIEINTNPGLEESSPLIKEIVPRMLDDALRLTIDVLFDTKYDHRLNWNRSNNALEKIDEDNLESSNVVANCSNGIMDKQYISPFKVKGYDDNENLWDYVCDLNEKDQYEIEKELERERLKKASFTGIKHLMKQRRQKAQTHN